MISRFNLVKMILPFFMFIVTGKVMSVCLKGRVENRLLYLDCKVEKLKANVEIYGPDKKLFGSCFGPTRFTPPSGDCDKNINISQNLHTNVTSIVTREDDAVYGVWLCKYGTGLGNDTFVVTRKYAEEICRIESHLKIVVPSCILMAFSVAACFGLRYKWHKILVQKNNKAVRNMRLEGIGEEYVPFVQYFKHVEGDIKTLEQSLCMTCHHRTAFAFCSNCSGFHCEHCYGHHEITNPEHKMVQIEHILCNNHSTKCSMCDIEVSTKTCVKCEKLFCNSCSCNHKQKPLLVKSTGANQECDLKAIVGIGMRKEYIVPLSGNTDEQHQNNGNYTENFIRDILHTRVCGFVVLSDDRIVVCDSNNRKLKIFQRELFQFSFNLEYEPRGITLMYDNTIAVTFPDLRVIKKYDIGENGVDKKDVIDLAKIEIQNRKPFSITYNQDVFAVEIGEREDGLIIILDFNGKLLYTITNAINYAYFTGHTLRLALDTKSKSVFITAMSKKSVTCLDFHGNEKWSIQLPSPRGLFYAAGVDQLKNVLLIASRRGNAIYQVNCTTQKYEMIAADGYIKGPRYIVYNQVKKQLYVHIFDEHDENYIVVFKYDIT